MHDNRFDALAAASPLASRPFSLYLDVWRSLAAIVVVMAHMIQDGFQLPFGFAWHFAHEAVIVFFVLSGLVIAHSTFANARGWREYVAARVGRLFAVIIPMTLLGIACASVVTAGEWPEKVVDRADWSFGEILLSWTFLARSYLIDADLPLNEPFWSLCYEAWYYTMFAIAVFAPACTRVWLIAACMAIAGPAILLLSPAWLAGVWLYTKATSIRIPFAAVIAVATVGIIVAMCLSGIPPLVRGWIHTLFPIWYVLRDSTNVVTDLAIAALFTLHLLATRTIVPEAIVRWQKSIRFVAGGTFTIYLMHRPLTQMLSGEPFAMLHGPIASVLTLVAIIGLALLISRVLERRLTDWLRDGLLRLLHGRKAVA